MKVFAGLKKPPSRMVQFDLHARAGERRGYFHSRQAWGRQVAYHLQFNNWTNRAHLGKARVKARLIADLGPDEWDLTPKPKWMRWRTYNRHVERHDAYEDILDRSTFALAAKLGRRVPGSALSPYAAHRKPW